MASLLAKYERGINMRKLMSCRRSLIAIFAITCLMVLGLYNGIDVSLSIASVAIGLAGANSYEASRKGKE
jgi:hypothetical protein